MMSEIYYLYHIFYICSVAYPNVLDKYIFPNVKSNWFSAYSWLQHIGKWIGSTYANTSTNVSSSGSISCCCDINLKNSLNDIL